MADELDELFDDPAERRAYEDFLEAQKRAGAEHFELDTPALVCRWRMAGKRVPLLNRHIRALSQRTVNGAPLTSNMLSWAKQHVEWSLAEGDAVPDGVVMLVIDVNGNAAMTVGAFESLPDRAVPALVARAEASAHEAEATGVAPEVLCAMAPDGALAVALEPGAHACGIVSLVEQLAETRGVAVRRAGADPAALAQDMASAADAPALFLASDEFGIAPAADARHPFIDFLAAGYEKLRDATRR